MNSKQRKSFSAALTGTQYVSLGGSAGAKVERLSTVSWTVDHPAATTTQYTIQVSNLTDQEVNLSQDDWADYSAITIPSKASAEKFGIEIIDCTFARVRLKAVTTVGSGTATVREHRKGWA